MAFILLGSNDASNPKTFEGHMRKIIEYSISQGVLPVLGTKADNVEKDHYINATIARLGAEYGVPVWNFWSAVQDLPKKGLQNDGVHLTVGTPRFDDPANLKNAWPVRNLNALQILKIVMEQTGGE
jgi:lysophospholipase L1-like esterase